MAETTSPTVTDPNTKGTKTSEFNLTVAVSVLGAVVAGLSVTIAQLKDVLPNAGWIAIAAGIVGGLGTVLGVVSKYVGGRAEVKTGQLQLQAAEALRDASVAQGVAISPPTIAGTTFKPPTSTVPK